MEDRLSKLRPCPPTPPEERCRCAAVSEIYLAHMLSRNPFYCLCCNGEIPPEALSLTEEAIETVASWNSVYGALYALWLDSGEYESWAESQLLNPKGQVNEVGLRICRNLLGPKSAYYLWFYAEPEARPTACPSCNAGLVATAWGGRLACHVCRIVV